MKKTELEKIKKLVEFYRKKLGLDDYFIEVYLAEDDCISSDPIKTEIIKSDYCGEVVNKDCSTRHYSMLINKNYVDESISDTICHELIHVLLWEFVDIVESVLPLLGLTRERKHAMLQDIWDREHLIIDRLMEAVK